MCREGQFGPGRKLCIGLAVDALRSTDTFCCYLGKNKDVSYVVDTATALAYADEHQSYYKSRLGNKITAILPLEIFTKKGKK